MKRDDLITQLYLAMVASGELPIGNKEAAEAIRRRLAQLDAVRKHLGERSPSGT
jgi:hypothetical protein